MKTTKVIIDVESDKLKVWVQDDKVNFNVFEAMNHPNDKKDNFRMDTLNEVCWEFKGKTVITNPL